MTQTIARRILLEGVDNLRDFGGYATACGRGLKPGRLYRSAAHHQATDADLQALARLEVAVIVDLRRSEERAQAPSRRWTGFAAEVVDNDIPDPGEAWDTVLGGREVTPALFHEWSLAFYRSAPFAPRLVDLYSRYFAALAEGRGPVLIHCAAGKDRTGLLAALTHHLAGVAREDMVEDFLLTNAQVFPAARIEQVAGMVAAASGRPASDEAVRAAMRVEAGYLDAALAEIDARYGSVDAYLEQVLGVHARRRAGFEANCLA